MYVRARALGYICVCTRDSGGGRGGQFTPAAAYRAFWYRSAIKIGRGLRRDNAVKRDFWEKWKGIFCSCLFS